MRLREFDLTQKAISSPRITNVTVTHRYTPTYRPEILIRFREKITSEFCYLNHKVRASFKEMHATTFCPDLSKITSCESIIDVPSARGLY
jgi:hypothetical protein